MSGHGEKISRRREAAIAALLNSPNLEKAAAECGIAVSTLRRWLKDDEFATLFAEAKSSLVRTATADLRKEMRKGVRVLASIAGNRKTPPAQRVSAAIALIRLALDAHESENLEERIKRLEREMERDKR
jgi:transposase-like protein